MIEIVSVNFADFLFSDRNLLRTITGQEKYLETHKQSSGRVELVNATAAIVRTRRAPDAWDYQTIVVPASQQAAAALADAGREGWEVTGVQFPAANNSLVLLLKRPR